MDGGYAPGVAAPRVRRGTRMLAFVASSLLGVAANRALADDAAALRPLAKRYADPTQLFDTEENDLQFKQVVDAQKSFRVPPPSAPPIRFAMEEPPAFVMSLGQTRYRLDATAPAPAAKISTQPRPEQRPIAVTAKPQSEPQPASAAPPSQNYQRPFPLSSQRPKSLVVVRVPQPPAQRTESTADSQPVPPELQDTAQMQPIQSPVAAAADVPPQNYQRPFPLSVQQPKSLVVVRVPQQPTDAAANPQQLPLQLDAAPQSQSRQAPVVTADTQTAQPAVSTPVSPRESAGRVVVASSQDSTAPPVRFAEGNRRHLRCPGCRNRCRPPRTHRSKYRRITRLRSPSWRRPPSRLR